MISTKIHILLVEDVKIQQKLAIMTLQAFQCEIDAADTGIHAIELINKKNYDLILMDLGLADIDGLTLTETIRKMEGKIKHTPIIALTAHADSSLKASCLKIGMDDFIVKPLTIESVQALFHKHFHQKGSLL